MYKICEINNAKRHANSNIKHLGLNSGKIFLQLCYRINIYQLIV